MTLNRHQLGELEGLLREAVASELTPRLADISTRTKTDGSLVTDVDEALQGYIATALARHCAETPLLGEEMAREAQQAIFEAERQTFWCLDPLDGTTNFASGLPYYAVSLALIERGQIVAGVVYDPCRDESFSALAGQGAWLNGQPLRVTAGQVHLRQAIAAVDMKRLGKRLAANLCQHAPFRSARSFGAVALEWCWLAAGRMQLYAHGAQNLWDYAAGSLVAREAGCQVGLADQLCGTPGELSLTRQAAVGAANQTLYRQWTQWLIDNR